VLVITRRTAGLSRTTRPSPSSPCGA